MTLIKNLSLNKKYFIFGVLGAWGLFALFAMLPIYTHHQMDQLTSALIMLAQVGVLAVSFALLTATDGKKIFSWFVIANIALEINRVSFYFGNYVDTVNANTPMSDMTFYSNFLCALPILFYSIAIIIFLSKILVPNILSRKFFSQLLCAFFIFNILIVSLFFLSMNHVLLSPWVFILCVVTIFCKLLLFDILMLCFICTENIGIVLLLSGIASYVAAATFTEYIYFSQINITVLYSELFCLLGTLLVLLGLIFLNVSRHKHFTQTCFRKFNAVKSQLALWTFGISTLGFLLFFIIAYVFSLINKIVFGGLPFFIMMYSVIIASLSLLIGKAIESSFKKIINNIESVIDNKKSECVSNTFYIEEFTALQKFIMHVMQIYNERDEARKQLREISDQVVHDIRSPLSALNILAEQQLSELEESKRIMLRNAVYQIRDIVNNLDQNALSVSADIQIAILLEQVISERRTALSEKYIVINQNFNSDAYKLFIYVSPSELKRVLTNLMNNSAEAMQSKNSVINVTLNSDHDKINITIADNGAGIPSEKIPSLFTRGFTTKKTGSGLGLFYAREVISKCNGEISLTSILNEGTTITIKIPAQIPPIWFTAQLILPKNSIAVCVDDSISIWNVWQEKLKTVASDLELRYCKNKSDLLRELNTADNKTKTYLVDYEFSGQSYTGLELIKKIFEYKKEQDQVLLVTSRSDEIMQNFCVENNIKIVSKFFAVKIPVVIANDER